MIISFGFLHAVPAAHLLADVRKSLSDPARMSEELRDSDGLDPRVQRVVWETPGAADIADALVVYAKARPNDVIAIGCAGGRHRSVVLANEVARLSGHEVQHMHIHLPRVLS